MQGETLLCLKLNHPTLLCLLLLTPSIVFFTRHSSAVSYVHVLINQFLPSYQARTKPSLFEQDMTYLKISHDHSITELELLS